ncbi:MAG: hypothetical protein A3A04_00460 [Candidatus Harrisonbacteria bacterium RIFCSPLOWO2_01_FULL_40_28]|uniref:Penicillin-binding protein transpeptidase domain-containing protein n=1 Tax=Candidatus Harrisonbacteria bacterium RIFCSPLOWO2_01_FULL_40_28 TaxID=1798406 RepID=A0A1G1ZRQ7_9BACT|nr:MAG: hypothetical protein A3A04_00460 [Candidatus Harrisonbacteria bacterium RIFCSPLOWO2_01_FULL_40_28]
MGSRSFVLAFVFSTIFVFLGFHLYKIQIQHGSEYSSRAEAQNRGIKEEYRERGSLFFTDKHGNEIPVAINKEYPLIYAVPKEIVEKEEIVQFLARVSNRPEGEIKALIAKRNSLYAPIVLKATNEQVRQVKEYKGKGVYVKNKLSRFYPFGDLASHLLGFVGFDKAGERLEGRYGIEQFYEDTLLKKESNSLYLSIDRTIQSEARDILAALIKKHSAAGGTIIVQDPKTGKILALENQPNFNPNEYEKYPVKYFLNPAVQAVYEPGSVLKVVTMALGLDRRKVTPETTYIDKGEITINDKTIRNWDQKAYGITTMSQIIERSINTGAVFVERAIGHNDFYEGLLSFGFGKKTGVGIPGEVVGNLQNLEKKNRNDVDFATASFGQGISMTPLQLISAVSALAYKGILMKPLILKNEKPVPMRQVISLRASREIVDMMTSAVDKAEIAAIPHYSVAGKTGTAEVPDFVRGGYTHTYIHTYAGFAPSSDPQFTILIKLDKPQNAPVAAVTVVPAFRELTQFLLNYYNIPPDRLP